MATYALTFATRAAFDTALASGSIYTLMQGVTSSKPSVAVVAHITESGETFACGTNVMVDIKSAGPGDMVMYDSTNAKYFAIARKWIDNNYPSQPTQAILIYKSGVLPSRFVECGTVIKRFGNKIRIAGTNTSLPWSSTNQSDYAWNVDTITSQTTVVKKGGSTTPTDPVTGNTLNVNSWCAFPSRRYQEARFTSGDASYLPITRSAWNTAIASLGNSPTATISITVGETSKTFCPAAFDYNYDKFIDYFFGPRRPAATGAYKDRDGLLNTLKIVTNFITNHGKSATSVDYAAGYCYNFSKNAPGLGKHQWFLGTLADMGEVRPLSHTLVSASAWFSARLWSCCQFSASGAWYVFGNGFTNYGFKYGSFLVVPLADLILTT